MIDVLLFIFVFYVIPNDSTILKDGNRGFQKTSMSMAVFIQPQPLLEELGSMSFNDGFMDRILFFTVKPKLYESTTRVQNQQGFNEYPDNVMANTFMRIVKHHQDSDNLYLFSKEAETYFNELSDNFTDFYKSKYDSDSGKGFIILVTHIVTHNYSL